MAQNLKTSWEWVTDLWDAFWAKVDDVWRALGVSAKFIWTKARFPAEIWFLLASASFIGTTTLAYFVARWVYEQTDVDEKLKMAQSFTPFGAILIGIVSFFTIAWRGALTSEQVKQQRRQNDANDDANYVKLLQEGAKMLAEVDKRAQILAGIASLSVVITEPRHRFASEAMDLLADYVENNYSGALNGRLKAAMRALAVGDDLGISSSVEGVLKAANDKPTRWAAPRGFRTLNFRGGAFHKRGYAALIKDGTRTSFNKVRLEYCVVAGKIEHNDCTFYRCRIRLIDAEELQKCTFVQCDFSDAKVVDLGVEYPLSRDLSGGNNYYVSDTPQNLGGLNPLFGLQWYPDSKTARQALEAIQSQSALVV